MIFQFGEVFTSGLMFIWHFSEVIQTDAGLVYGVLNMMFVPSW